MYSIRTASALCCLIMPFLVSADTTTLDFEDLPDAYFFSGGDQNIADFYSGITFGPDVTGLSVSRFGGYDDSGFPPHSGDVVVWDATDPTVTISFESPLQYFGIWYTSFDPLTLAAFDSGGNPLDTTVGAPNTDGTTGTSTLLSLADAGVQSVTLTSAPGFFVLDDLTFNTEAVPTPVPEGPTYELYALAFVLPWLGASRKKRASQTSLWGKQ